MYLRAKFIIVMFLLSLFTCSTSNATVYFYWDAETHPCDGSELPNPPFWTQEVSHRGHVTCGETKQGNKYFEWTTGYWTNHYTEIHNTQGLPVTCGLEVTYYLAYFFNFTRINNQDIWHESGQSGDKGIEITGSGIRWEVARGHWESMSNNQDHHYTVWVGNPTYHLNPSIEIVDTLVQNRSGFSASNPIQLEYDRWYAAVMAIKMATGNTGSIALYIDGVKVLEYDNIKTAANSSPILTDIKMGGTIAQPAYDAPPHYRKFDALMLTDDWQDIVYGGYLARPVAPKNLRIAKF
jgi:hypothetical protein